MRHSDVNGAFYFCVRRPLSPVNAPMGCLSQTPAPHLRDAVRMLSVSMTGPIDMDNLAVSKEVLRRKFIVGLLDNKRGSFARFDHYFKWKER
jgi:hypothetical protein